MSARIFCDPPLAARIDRAEARMCAEFAHLVGSRLPGARVTTLPLAGGLAVYAGPGAPMNKVIGVGLGDTLDAGALAEVEAEWESRREPVRVELSTLDDGAAARLLTARGYRLLGFENVLGRRIDARGAVSGDRPARRSCTIGDEDLERWIQIMLDAFAQPDAGPLPTEEHQRDELAAVFRDISRMSGVTAVSRDGWGDAAAAASVRFDGRPRAADRRGHAGAVSTSWPADGADDAAARGRAGRRMRSGRRDDEPRIEISAERPAARIRAAVFAGDIGQVRHAQGAGSCISR